jgi:hypothetical protein
VKSKPKRTKREPVMLVPPREWSTRGTAVDARVFRAFADVLRALAPLSDAEKTRVIAAAAALLTDDEDSP